MRQELGKARALTANAFKQTWNETRRNKCTYCIGCSSIFLVVIVASVVQTLVKQAPLIFLRDAESQSGQVDFSLTASTYSGNNFVNYTQLARALAEGPEPAKYQYHAPRHRLSATLYPAAACIRPGSSGSGSSDNSWMYRTATGEQCGTTYGGYNTCLPRHCAARSSASGSLLLIDSDAEVKMGYGREWPANDPIPPGSVILHGAMAKKLQVGVGDVVYLQLREASLLRSVFQPRNGSVTGWDGRAAQHADIALPFTVHRVMDGLKGKLGDDDGAVAIAEYGSFVPYAARRLNPAIAGEAAADADAARLYHYAGSIHFNLPPAQRVASYSQPDYDRVRAAVADFASNVLFLAGFTETDSDLPILTQLEPRRFIQLYMGILLDVLLLILFALSTVLIYSLLLINVGNRTFEIAVRRMLGAGKPGILFLVIFQSFSYSIPAWIGGLIIAQLVATFLLAGFTSLSGLKVGLLLSKQAVGAATALAIAIPAIAAIGPARVALGPSIREALDADRPKASAVKVTIERADGGNISWPAIVVGTLTFCFGFGVYYVMPLALISLNLSLLLNLFIVILIGFLAGLVMLAMNLELLVSRALMRLLLSWWERPAILTLTATNLVGHRLRNRKTVLMYALSIAFIVFITVAAQQQLTTASYTVQQRAGAALTLSSDDLHAPDAVLLAAAEAVVRKFATGEAYSTPATSTVYSPPVVAGMPSSSSSTGGVPFLTATAWGTRRLDQVLASLTTRAQSGTVAAELQLQNLGRLYPASLQLYGVSPRLYEGAVFQEFFVPGEGEVAGSEESALNLAEQLYTLRGAQGIAVSKSMDLEMGLHRNLDATLQSIGVKIDANGTGQSTEFTRSRLSVAGMITNSPRYRFARAPNGADNGLAALSTLARLADVHATAAGLPRIQHALLQDLWRAQLAEMEAAAAGRGVDVANGTAAAVAGDGAALRAAYLHLLLGHTGADLPATMQGSSSSSEADAATAAVYAEAGTASLRNGVSIDDLPLDALFIGLDSKTVSTDTVAAFKKELNAALGNAARARAGITTVAATPDASLGTGMWDVGDTRSRVESLGVTLMLLNLFFAVLTLVAMALCFFSLLASMIASITEQRKEIGVLMAVGLRASHMIRVYVHEAFLLVCAASLLGVIIGCLVAYIFGEQQSLFTSVPMPFIVPWGTIITVVLASAVAGVLSACLPAVRLTRRPITALLRGN